LGHTYTTKIVILFSCFFFTAPIIYWEFDSKITTKRIPLSQAVNNLKGWEITGFTNLGKSIVEALNLDDYVNQNYFKGNKTVSLYIGYYNTGKKVGAAHSPLVCFPGQGWVVSKAEDKSVNIKNHTLNFKSMIITKGKRKELIFYWFQAYDKTSSGTLLQKVYTLQSKFFQHREDNAFVRVAIPITATQSKESSFKTGIEFIKIFYPDFFKYITSS
jgi:EpsI family protein